MYLISTFKPIKVKIVKQQAIDGSLVISNVDDREEKLHALQLFRESHEATQPDGSSMDHNEALKQFNQFFEYFENENLNSGEIIPGA